MAAGIHLAFADMLSIYRDSLLHDVSAEEEHETGQGKAQSVGVR